MYVFRGSRVVLGGCLAFSLLLAAGLGVGGCGGSDDGGGGGTEPLPCAITNVSIGTQTSWLIGVDGDMNVRWDHQGSATAVRIDLLKAGAAVAVVAASTANDGFHTWVNPSTASQPDGDDFGLRVTALGEAGCAGEKTGLTLTDVSDCALTWAMADLDSVIAGGSLSLDWSSQMTGGLLDIELWQDDLGGEPRLVGLVAADTPDDGQFTWDPVDSFHFGTNEWFFLRLSATIVPGCDATYGPFKMVDDVLCACRVSGFRAGSAFSELEVVGLDLEQDFGSGRVDLRLLAGAELVPGGIIADNVPVNEAYEWTVSDYGYTGAERTRFRIRAVDAEDGYCVGQSDVFTIR